ncbi:MAG TPA: hypothetical protein VMU84_04785 [Thermoanaerobaculia bacterium]|nr:hypothetical protein [Thermoanaerobaculia bacterium]
MRKWIPLCALLLSASALAAVPSTQRQALIAIYDNTGGASWKVSTGWKGAEGTECTWAGVGCDEGGNNVIGLELFDNNLTGPFPAQIANLPELKYVQFQDNNLTGSLPPQIAQLTNLELLYLIRNQLTGPIPHEIGALKKLTRLGLDGNHFEGPLPKELGDASALEELGLSVNAITGSIPPELGKLTNLVQLELSVNQFTGALPKELGALAKLEQFAVTDNQLGGTLPKEFGDLTSLAGLRLSYNQITGTIPAEFGKLKNLQELSIQSNQLQSPIPSAIGDLPALRYLYLNANNFTGTFPTDVLRLANLTDLGLGENQFTGEIPKSLNALTKLEVLGLYSNQFTGTIPSELGSITSLRSLELEGNDLSGTIPSALGDLTSLTWLDLSGNQLAGTIPPTLGKLAKLEVLSLYDNQLEGSIPSELGSLSKLNVLYLGINKLSGAIPESFRNLHAIREFHVSGNNLGGSIPTWIGELTNITDLVLSYNQFTGTIPPGIGNLPNLIYADFLLNQLTGHIPPELGNAHKLITLDVGFNQLDGPLPSTFGQLENLNTFICEFNALSGPFPREIGSLPNLEYMRLGNNEFDGAIPPELGNLKKLYHLSAFGNRFSGAIPKEIGNLTALQELDLSYNALRGAIPTELRSLTQLRDGRSDLEYNSLFTGDAALRAFLAQKLYRPEWESTQTITPANVKITQTTDRSATIEWSLIPYLFDEGGYQVVASTTPGGAPVRIATTGSKEVNSIIVRNLNAQTTYFFTVAAVTHPHDYQHNLITSDPSAPVTSTTGPRVLAPADVDITEPTSGLVQIDSVPRNEDNFTLANFGDTTTTITLNKGDTFFTVEPETFSLAGGASQVVKIKSLPQPVGTYYSYVQVTGDGTSDGNLFANVFLLSSAKPPGTVVAEAVTTRIEIAGTAGSNSVGVARFKNSGTATLTGILVSNEPWVVPPASTITIDPGVTASINFTINRAKRPAVAGAITAELSLIYVDGSANFTTFDTSASGVSVSKVTVIDVTKPTVAPGTVTAPAAGEIALFAPGIAAFQRAGGAYGSDLSIVNARSAVAISDLRLFFTPAGATATSVASLTPIASSASVNLVNVVTNVYGESEGVGTLQLQSTDWESLAVQAKLTNVKPAGTFSGDVPVFRADRSVRTGEAISLAGVRRPADVYVQETLGSSASVRIEFFDANGNTLTTTDRALGAFQLVELRDAAPAGTSSAIVRNLAGSGGRIVAYARMSDESSGDTWSVVDWSRYFRYATTEPVRIPFADGRVSSTSAPSKRRAISPKATTIPPKTDIAIFNPTSTDTLAKVRVIDTAGRVSERDITIGAHKTSVLSDIAGSALTPTAHVIVEPLRNELVVSARSARSGFGAAIPIVTATAGLRVGQSQVFTGLDDSTSSTVTAATPSTFRTSYGFVETSGESVTVRAHLIISEERSIAVANIERDFDLGPRQQLVLSELVRSFAGDARDTAFSDLHGLRLQIEVLAGKGSIVPFVIVTDNGSGDSVLRLE